MRRRLWSVEQTLEGQVTARKGVGLAGRGHVA
jgi:hypothetical protein